MTQDKFGGRNTAVKAMLIRAWRERWTPSQFGTQIKSLVNKSSMAGEMDVELADQIISLTANGPSPNQLLLDLLDHSIASQLTSYTAVVNSICRFNKYHLPHCTAAFINFVIRHKTFITCRGDAEDYVQFSLSLVSLATWIMVTASSTLLRLAGEASDSKVDLKNLQLCVDILQWLSTDDSQISCVLYTGKFEDVELYQELLMAAKGLAKANEQIQLNMIIRAESQIQAQLNNLSQKIKSQEPIQSDGPDKWRSELLLCMQSVVSYDVILDPTSDLTQLSGQLTVIMNMRKVSFATMVCELTRICLLGLIDCDRWDAFTLLKLNRLIERIQERRQDGGKDEVYQGLLQVLKYHHLLNITDAKCKANTYELIVMSFSSMKRQNQPLINDTECKQLLSARQSQIEKRNLSDGEFKSNVYMESRDINTIFKADTTVATIIKTFENRTTEPNEFENLLSVMFHIVKGSSFDLLLSAASANGTLPILVTKLLFFNKGTQESMGESNKVAQNRAALFDMTFLMLVYIVQCFSTSILPVGGEGIFPRWARLCMTEPGNVKPLEAFKDLGGTEALVDGLLNQMMQGEIRVQVIKWNQVCASVHDVMKEILLGLEMGAINQDTYNRLLHQLSNKLCCFPICIASWLVSSAHYGEEDPTGARPMPLTVLDQFINIPEGEDSDTRPFFAKRNNMMVNILKNMRKEVQPPKQGDIQLSNLSSSFSKLWDSLWSRSQLTMQGTKELARLYSTGGTHWFVKMVTAKLNSQVYSEEVRKCVDMLFSMMHIDLPACTLSLLMNTIPALLQGSGEMESLCYPAGSALARLVAQCLAATLNFKSSGPYTTKKRKFRSVELSELCNEENSRVKLRKVSSSDVASAYTPEASQEQLINKAHNSLYQLFTQMCMDSSRNPKLEFVYSFIEECTQLEGEDCHALLSPLPPTLLYHLIRMDPSRFAPRTILRIFDVTSVQGRRSALTSLCLLRNIRSREIDEDMIT